MRYARAVTTGPGAVDASWIAPGTLLDGKYAVERVLGSGTMGSVVSARHVELGEPRALKLLHPLWLNQPDKVERFKLEARAAVKLKSPHVARVFDVGTLPGGRPYIVMEQLTGSDLAAYLATQGRLDTGEAVDLVVQACDALAEAHALGIVHRDLKPANLFVHRTSDGHVTLKVLDFGVAKIRISPSTMSATDENEMIGTPRYMAPEQTRMGAPVDARTDIWALGSILYQLVTGSPPFTGRTLTELIGAIVAAAPRPPRELRPDLPGGLADVILRCLEKAPAKRWASAAELSEALAPYRAAREVPAARAAASSRPPGAPTRRFAGLGAGPLLLALTGLLVGGGAGTVASIGRARERLAQPREATSAARPTAGPSAVPGPTNSATAAPPASVGTSLETATAPRASSSGPLGRPLRPATSSGTTAAPPPTGDPDPFGNNRR